MTIDNFSENTRKADEFLDNLETETKDSISESLKVETEHAIPDIDYEIELYKNAYKKLSEMEQKFWEALWDYSFDHYDWELDTKYSYTEFEKLARGLRQELIDLQNTKEDIGFLEYKASVIWRKTWLYKNPLNFDYLLSEKLGKETKQEKLFNKMVDKLLDVEREVKNHIVKSLETDWKLPERETKINSDIENLEFETDLWRIKFSEIEDYEPETTTEKIDLWRSQREYFEWPDLVIDLGLDKDENESNIDATDINEFTDLLVNLLEENPNVLKELEIQDIYNLSPKEAILLSSKIVKDKLEFSLTKSSIDKNVNNDWLLRQFIWLINTDWISDYKLNESVLSKLPQEMQDEIRENPKEAYKKYSSEIDQVSMNELFESNSEVSSKNYSQAVKLVFDILKEMQDPDTTQLKNTYCKQHTIDLWEFDDSEIVSSSWNTFYTISPHYRSNVDVVIIDAAHADSWLELDWKISYSEDKFLFNLINLEKQGLISKEEKIYQLEYWAKYNENRQTPLYKSVCSYIANYYKEIWETYKYLKWMWYTDTEKEYNI